MNYFINSIRLDDAQEYKNYQQSLKSADLNLFGLSKINIFLGANNSGKSRLMRKIVSQEHLKFIPSNPNYQKILELRNEIRSKFAEIQQHPHVDKQYNFNQMISPLGKEDYINENEGIIKNYNNFILTLSSFGGRKPIEIYDPQHQYTFEELAYKYNNSLKELTKDLNIDITFKKIYVPTLRGLRSLTTNDNYHLRTKNDYFSDKDVNIFTGLELYRDLKDLLLGTRQDRDKVAKYQKFLGETFFQGSEVTLTPAKDSDVVLVQIGDEEYSIQELGDGIQSLIILTFPLFSNIGEKMLIFIEEPELYLHPSMQRKLLETFMQKEFEGFQFFLTTHSNHLLDITLDMEQISIYTFKKEIISESSEVTKNFVIENVSNEDNNLLEMLGVQNSSVYLSNCTIWVEGITDRYYIRKYLKIYQDSLGHSEKSRFKEDYHYSFVEYSGNNITHWSFLDNDNEEKQEDLNTINVDRICRKLFLITDKDSKNKESRQEKLQNKLKENYYCLECKEIENLISVRVLKKVILDYEKKNSYEEPFAKDVKEEDYKDCYLGRFIDDNIKEDLTERIYSKNKDKDKSGTIKDKLKFCEKVIKYTESFDDLSEEAKRMCEQIYSFIQKNNENLAQSFIPKEIE